VSRLQKNGFLVGALCLAIAVCKLTTAADPPAEDAVEAAFLYRFAGYVEWPPQALASPKFTIAVLGDEAVVQELRRILPQHRLKNRPARVLPIGRIEDLGTAQILFVGPGYNDRLQTIIPRLADRSVLVVTASDHGLDAGSCVNFLLIDGRVRFEISTIAAEHSGLKVSAELLSVAVRVQGREAR
jgi:hypothetical protein